MFEDTVVHGLIKFCFLRCLVIPIRRLLAWIYNSTGSIAFVGLVHAASNASAFALVSALYHHTGDA
jgi:hypothetical protein